MTKNYLLHRISHEYGVSQNLLKHGYLSIGFSEAQALLESAIGRDWDRFNAICATLYPDGNWWHKGNLKRNQLWRFLKRSIGDIVVVPLWYGQFSICEVVGSPLKISDFDLSVLGADKEQLNIKDGYLYDGDRPVDIGFVIPVKLIKENLSRSKYADSRLSSMMKFQATNKDIYTDDDIASVERVIKAETPINLHNNLIEHISTDSLEIIRRDLTPDKLEKLILWFMNKQGFTAESHATNESGKKDFADADITATSEFLKLIVQIQAKFHKGVTGGWGVEQISKYAEQKNTAEDNDEYTYVQWLITTADDFTEDAKIKAVENDVRLIKGSEFAQMLLDAGIENINDAFS